MTAPRAIDHAVVALFRAMVANARGDLLMVVDARSELFALAPLSTSLSHAEVIERVQDFIRRVFHSTDIGGHA